MVLGVAFEKGCDQNQNPLIQTPGYGPGQVAPKFEVCNGLRLRCAIAPTLFKTFTLGWSLSSGGRSVVNLKWMSFISMCVCVCVGGGGGGGAKRPSQTKAIEPLFADDAAAVVTSRECIDRVCSC